MLLGIAFVKDRGRPEMQFLRHGPDGPQMVEGHAHAVFFSARIEFGWLVVPREQYEELHRLEDAHA
jgi:hypothetical protein